MARKFTLGEAPLSPLKSRLGEPSLGAFKMTLLPLPPSEPRVLGCPVRTTNKN